MKKFILKGIISLFAISSLYAVELYNCAPIQYKKNGKTYKLSLEEMKKNKVSFSIDNKVLDDGVDKFKYLTTVEGVRYFVKVKDKYNKLLVGVKEKPIQDRLYGAIIITASKDGNYSIIMICKKNNEGESNEINSHK